MDNKKIVLWVVIALLLLVTLFLTFKTGNTVAVQGAGAATKSASSSYGGMVGGC